MKSKNEFTIKTPKDILIPCVTYYKDDKRTLPFSDPLIPDCEYIVSNLTTLRDKMSFDLFDDDGYICTQVISKDDYKKLIKWK